jgi:hypothetical protein
MINKSVVRGSGIPNYSNALGSISMTIYSPHRIPAGFNAGRLITNQSKKGLRWFNNGKENRQFREGMQHEGFVNGRVTKK